MSSFNLGPSNKIDKETYIKRKSISHLYITFGTILTHTGLSEFEKKYSLNEEVHIQKYFIYQY